MESRPVDDDAVVVSGAGGSAAQLGQDYPLVVKRLDSSAELAVVVSYCHNGLDLVTGLYDFDTFRPADDFPD